MTLSNDQHDRPNVPTTSYTKGITPFFFNAARGRLIRLGPVAHVLLERHRYPDCIIKLGGEALALVAGLASSLKFEGSFSLQIKGKGIVSLLVADCTHKGELRFYIRYNKEKINKYENKISAKTLLGKGLFVLTIDQLDKKDNYQGMVELKGETLAEMAMHYFESSVQFPCSICLFCEKYNDQWQAGGLILEKITNDNTIQLKTNSKNDIKDWNTITILANTITIKELFDQNLDSEKLLYRLFNNIDFTLGKAKSVSYGCRCSRSHLKKVLNHFTKNELDTMEENGNIIVTCEFCYYNFVFPRNQI